MTRTPLPARIGVHGRRLVLLLAVATLGGAAGPLVSAPPSTVARPVAQPAGAPSPTSPARLRVVGLGDSVMAGTACGCAGIVARYAAGLQRSAGRPVDATDLAVPGDTTADLRDLLTSNRSTRRAVGAADIVLVTVGANDLLPELDEWRGAGCDAGCYGRDAAAMGRELAADLGLIRGLRVGPAATVLVTTYWNVFTDGAVARRSGGRAQLDWSDAVTRAANQAICAAAASAQARCVDLDQPFADAADDPGVLLAQDGDHPNAAGVALIADALLDETPEAARH